MLLLRSWPSPSGTSVLGEGSSQLSLHSTDMKTYTHTASNTALPPYLIMIIKKINNNNNNNYWNYIIIPYKKSSKKKSLHNRTTATCPATTLICELLFLNRSKRSQFLSCWSPCWSPHSVFLLAPNFSCLTMLLGGNMGMGSITWPRYS